LAQRNLKLSIKNEDIEDNEDNVGGISSHIKLSYEIRVPHDCPAPAGVRPHISMT
jgi:hypothetical protein